MTFRERFIAKKSWMKGGLIASGICALLFGFYLFLYFPIFEGISKENQANNESDTIFILPTVTGHIFPFFSHFIIEGTSIASRLCTETKTECVYWSLEYEEGGVPWKSIDGDSGYCLQQETTPLTSCIERLEAVGTIVAIIILEMAYFIIGAIIGTLIERRKKR